MCVHVEFVFRGVAVVVVCMRFFVSLLLLLSCMVYFRLFFLKINNVFFCVLSLIIFLCLEQIDVIVVLA
jgi:hypothetical protein